MESVVGELKNTLDRNRDILQEGETYIYGNTFKSQEQINAIKNKIPASASYNPEKDKEYREEELEQLRHTHVQPSSSTVIKDNDIYLRKKSRTTGKIYYENRNDGISTFKVPKNADIFEIGTDGKWVHLEQVNPFPSCSLNPLSGYTRKRFLLKDDGTSFTRYCPSIRAGGKRYKKKNKNFKKRKTKLKILK